MLKRCGFKNILENKSRYPTLENMDALNPEVVLLSSEPYPFKEKHIQELHKIYPDAKIQLVDGEMFSWYGSRLSESVEYFKWLCTDI